jgi:hypothetical protein
MDITFKDLNCYEVDNLNWLVNFYLERVDDEYTTYALEKAGDALINFIEIKHDSLKSIEVEFKDSDSPSRRRLAKMLKAYFDDFHHQD